MIREIGVLHQKYQWGDTYIEQESGQYLITTLKQQQMPVKVITTGKKVKDPKKLDRIKVMDKIEMSEFLRKLMLNGQLLFPRNPSKRMKILEEQIPYFTKHTTEAGSVDYYAPGEEPDNMVRALMIACFSVRLLLQGNIGVAVCGPITGLKPRHSQMRDPEKEFLEAFPNSGRGF